MAGEQTYESSYNRARQVIVFVNIHPSPSINQLTNGPHSERLYQRFKDSYCHLLGSQTDFHSIFTLSTR